MRNLSEEFVGTIISRPRENKSHCIFLNKKITICDFEIRVERGETPFFVLQSVKIFIHF